MAANLDRAETSLTAVSDIAYIRGIDNSGNSVRISKEDLASVLGECDGKIVGAAYSTAFKVEFKPSLKSAYFTKLVAITNANYSPHVTEVYVASGAGVIEKKNTIMGNKAIVKVNSARDTCYIYYESGEGYQTALYFNSGLVKVSTIPVSTVTGDSTLSDIVEDSVPQFYKRYSTLAELKAALANT